MEIDPKKLFYIVGPAMLALTSASSFSSYKKNEGILPQISFQENNFQEERTVESCLD